MKNKWKISTIGLSILSVILIGCTIGLSIALFISNRRDYTEIDSIKNFEYVESTEYSSKELIDYDVSNFNLSYTDVANFIQSNMKIVQTTYGNYEGLSTTYLSIDDYTKVHNLSNTSYLTPYYYNNELDGLISGVENENGVDKISNWGKKEQSIILDEISSYDHEIVRYKDNNYILDGSNIWIGNDNKIQQFNFFHLIL